MFLLWSGSIPRIGYGRAMMDLSTVLAEPVARLGASTLTLGQALMAASILTFVFIVVLALALWRSARARAAAAEEAA